MVRAANQPMLFAATTFLGAFLLFAVQPVIARLILPWFGGSAAVWTTCMLCFQGLLLGGYFYAWALGRLRAPPARRVVHLLLVAAACVVLPIIPDPSWKPTGDHSPVLRILGLVAATVGLPYFALSTTAPLIQAWFSRRYPDRSPYRLYALSNTGSLLALLGYPFLVEPNLGTLAQARTWSWAFGVYAVMCAVVTWKNAALPEPAAEAVVTAARPSRRTVAMWVALPAVASTLLLAVTTHLTSDVASIPFLWVVPLALYLVSFIATFDAEGWYRRAVFIPVMAVSFGGIVYLVWPTTRFHDLWITGGTFCAGLLAACMVCHGELVRLKPHPAHLASFYLAMSVGGALGGVFVGVVAPLVFNTHVELEIGMALCAVLVLVVALPRPHGVADTGYRVLQGLMVSACLVLWVQLAREVHERTSGVRQLVRNFYGSMRVNERGDVGERVRVLLHGSINHGEQWVEPGREQEATTYYCAPSGAGVSLAALSSSANLRVGVVGLGTGTLAVHARPGDVYRYYEINPLVVELARTEFTFLQASKGTIETVLGDARLVLEREEPQRFDLLVVDAFSGDSIPVHLLTREAFEIYARHLGTDGTLAVHISNKFLDLKPVVKASAAAVGLRASLLRDSSHDDDEECFDSTWVLASASGRVLDHADVVAAVGKDRLPDTSSFRTWTDDYSDLLGAVK